MKAVLQRCRAASVEVDGEVVGAIESGLTIFIGIAAGDDDERAARLAQKIIGLRIFDNAEGRFDLSLRDAGGAVLAVPNFTLCGDARRGTRPSFSSAAPPPEAKALFERFVTLLRTAGAEVETGNFGAHMVVRVENDGPVTMVLDV